MEIRYGSQRVVITLNQDWYQAAQVLADREGMKVGTYVRCVLLPGLKLRAQHELQKQYLPGMEQDRLILSKIT